MIAGGIRTIPPGFTRGLDFGPLADDPNSALIEEEEEEVEVKPIYRPMLELSNEAGRARAITVRLHEEKLASSTAFSRRDRRIVSRKKMRARNSIQPSKNFCQQGYVSSCSPREIAHNSPSHRPRSVS